MSGREPFDSVVTKRYLPNKPKKRFRTIGERRLSGSLPNHVHPASINLIFYEGPMTFLFEGGFTLRCFQCLSRTAWLLGAMPCRTTDRLVAAKDSSSRTMSSFLSNVSQVQWIVYQLPHSVVNPANDPF